MYDHEISFPIFPNVPNVPTVPNVLQRILERTSQLIPPLRRIRTAFSGRQFWVGTKYGTVLTETPGTMKPKSLAQINP